MNTQQSQSGIFPRFYMDAKQSKRLTEEKGCPQYLDREMVEIRIAGDSKTVVVKKVSDEHKQRWPAQYEAFKKGQEAPLEGLPLKHCPLFTVAQVATMQASQIHTVEALAELPDSFLQRLGMGARGLQAKAKAYLKEAEGSAEVTKLAAENELMKQEIEMLKQQMKALGGKAPALTVVETIAPVETVTTDKKLPATFEEAKFSARTITALKKGGIYTLEDLFSFTLEDIESMPGVGISAMDEITRLFE